ncbi:hypothetical protein MKX01_030832 [Papaver californicum]|nr:hypothetical protein MKX01_030832 [Papaver californicum]
MATLILFRSARSALRFTVLASRCLSTTTRTVKPLSQRLGSVARLFSSKPLGNCIDLGYTNSCVAAIEGKSAKVIQNPKGGLLDGVLAKRRGVTDPTNIIFGTKSRRYSVPQTKKEKKLVPYKIVTAPVVMYGLGLMNRHAHLVKLVL